VTLGVVYSWAYHINGNNGCIKENIYKDNPYKNIYTIIIIINIQIKPTISEDDNIWRIMRMFTNHNKECNGNAMGYTPT
jgi:hypothetical protein